MNEEQKERLWSHAALAILTKMEGPAIDDTDTGRIWLAAYLKVLKAIPPAVGWPIIERLTVGGGKRPTPDAILDKVIDAHLPIPTPDAAFFEVMDNIDRYGQEAAPHPDAPHRFPTIRVTGEPAWSHPLVGEAVKAFGSYTTICTWNLDQSGMGTLKAQFRDAFRLAETAYREGIKTAILTNDRSSPYLRAYTPYRGAIRAVSLPAIAPPMGSPVPMPSSVEEAIKQLKEKLTGE